MRKNWLRGMLLGVSMALLLAGGVALAQMTLTVDQDCFECWPSLTAEPDAEHTVVVTLDDYPAFPICSELEIDGEIFFPDGECQMPEQEPPCEALLAVACQDLQLYMQNNCTGQSGFVGLVEYGDWVIRAWQVDLGQVVGPVREVALRFAEDCEAVEFVPEPGTIALLGSGLAGLAGYAALRWRARG
jgi:hypothetical protein